jgi:hypothetical protein
MHGAFNPMAGFFVHRDGQDGHFSSAREKLRGTLQQIEVPPFIIRQAPEKCGESRVLGTLGRRLRVQGAS